MPRRPELPETRWPTPSEARASLLFQPLGLGPIEAHTRTWVPAMVPWRATEDGVVTQDVLDWYARFAVGRPGVLVVEATGIRDVPSGPLLRIGHDRFLDGLRELVRVVRESSDGQTRLLIQIIDFLTVRRRPEPAKFFERFLRIRPEHHERLAALGRPSASEVEARTTLAQLEAAELARVLDPRELRDLEFGYRETVNDTHLEPIARLPEALPDLFGDAAVRARAAGFDGVELHFAHAYTMASFLSATNVRTDGYGGSRAMRARLPLEVIERVRQRVGSDFAVGCRFLGDEVIPGGSRIEDACDYAQRFCAAGLDFLSVSKGGKFDDARAPKVGQAVYPYTGPSGLECMPTATIDERGPYGRNLPLSAAVRQSVRAAGYTTPVVGAGGIATFELAERALADGACDFVGAARQSLADPDWFEKARTGRGDEVRRCVFTNYCEGLDQKHKQVTCQLWDKDFESPDVVGVAHPGSEPNPIARSSDGKRRLLAP